MRVDDFVCLGRTVPEESKTLGHRVCMAGVSQELGQLMRVYPLEVRNPIRCRHLYKMELQRNKRDGRKESWKLNGEIVDRNEKAKSLESQLMPHVSESIRQLNEDRMSLGVLKTTETIQGEFVERAAANHPDQGMLFETCDQCFGANAIHLAPYLNFTDCDGSHRLQLREWGCYEWIRKQPNNAGQLWKNMKLGTAMNHYLVIGNMNNRRNVWLVIKHFCFPVEEQKQFPQFNRQEVS